MITSSVLSTGFESLLTISAAHLFAEPVDIASRGCDEYYQIILDPIDLHTMRQKNARGEYHNIKAFKNDFDRMISNCLEYNYVMILEFHNS